MKSKIEEVVNMDCQDPITHVVRSGDTLYDIARRYNTSVQTLLADNGHLNIYNLRIGEEILICPGDMGTYAEAVPMPIVVKATPGPIPQISDTPKMAPPSAVQDPVARVDGKKVDPTQLSKKMRELWMEHIMWTRMLIESIMDSLGDTGPTTMRLLRNPGDIARVFEPFYGDTAAKQIEMLMTKHLTIADQLVRAIKRFDGDAIDKYSRQWEDNAKDMAELFSKLNPYYNYDELLKMFESHLDLTKREAGFRFGKEYDEDVAIFDDIEKQAMQMADYFTSGLMKQFAHMMG